MEAGLRRGKLTVAAIKYDGEANTRGERCHENSMQSVARYLPESLKVDRADSIVESAVAIAIWIWHLPTCDEWRAWDNQHAEGGVKPEARPTHTVATVMKKEGVSSVVIRHQPVEGRKHGGAIWLITGIGVVVGEYNHAKKTKRGSFMKGNDSPGGIMRKAFLMDEVLAYCIRNV